MTFQSSIKFANLLISDRIRTVAMCDQIHFVFPKLRESISVPRNYYIHNSLVVMRLVEAFAPLEDYTLNIQNWIDSF